ncbi:MAG: anaerobic ribonucleoside-triphosphate reductase activating protein [Schwartzia sp.]|jgi:anaerobic ribonucleoside-triphosphate reductase activating protein|nr:anaerobic ribonucleoside-triphosphate reductase activating protein [Schwartzia sp. (in: firmicutes)]MBQ4152218.1 anaerobic ribonucleoside-triphosphate reductase activating protein [Schwartzia sp. (in: firmicutes)]
MKLRIAGLVDDSIVDGEGYRFTVFTQGCPHHCEGCHNPETWDPQGGRIEDTDKILSEILQNPLLQGVTFSGGEPFAQAAPLAELAKKIHSHGLDIWSYTGYTYEKLCSSDDPAVHALLDELDVLVDGPFVLSQKDLTLEFRGSKNQRVIDMNATRKEGRVVLKYND